MQSGSFFALCGHTEVNKSSLGRKGCNSSYEQRQFVLYHDGKCKSQRQIANMLHLSKSTIGNNVIRYKKEDRIESIPWRDQPKELHKREERFILRMVKTIRE